MMSYSVDTQELLDRAHKAIERSIRLRDEHATQLKTVQQMAYETAWRQYRLRAAAFGHRVRT